METCAGAKSFAGEVESSQLVGVRPKAESEFSLCFMKIEPAFPSGHPARRSACRRAVHSASPVG